MNKAKWFVFTMAMVMAIALCFAGCNQQTPEPTSAPEVTTEPATGEEATQAPEETGMSTEPVTIQFWNQWTGADGDLLRQLVDYYNANNKDGVTVEMDIMEMAALTQKMATALASDTAPALSLQATNGEYAVNGQLVAIDDIFDKTGMSKDDFVQAILDQQYFNGQLLGLPFQNSSMYLYWNKALFEAAGLNPEAPPTTWEQMYEFSKAITNPDNNVYGGGFAFDDAVSVACMMLSYGGKLINGESVDTFTSALLDPQYNAANSQAMQLYEKMIDEQCVPAFSGADEMFLAGTLGMRITGAWLVGGCKTAENLDWGISLLPAGPQGIVQVAMPMSFVVMKGAEGREVEACYQFINYWNNNINNPLLEVGNTPAAQWCKTLGFQPYLTSVATDPTFTSDPIVAVTNSYVDHIQSIYPNAYYKFFPLLTDVLTPMLQNVSSGAMTADEGLADADNLLKQQIASYTQG